MLDAVRRITGLWSSFGIKAKYLCLQHSSCVGNWPNEHFKTRRNHLERSHLSIFVSVRNPTKWLFLSIYHNNIWKVLTELYDFFSFRSCVRGANGKPADSVSRNLCHAHLVEEDSVGGQNILQGFITSYGASLENFFLKNFGSLSPHWGTPRIYERLH